MAGRAHADPSPPSVAVFGPDPLLSVALQTWAGADDVQLEPAGQGVWVATMARELGAAPILCGLFGGQVGQVVQGLVRQQGIEVRATQTSGTSGSLVFDRRGAVSRLLAASRRPAPSRDELDDLVALTTAAALDSGLLIMTNPLPAEGFPLDVYDTVAANARAAGVDVLADLSTPRLDRVLPHRPQLVKLNDWELAEYIRGPVDGARALAAARRLQAAGAHAVAVTRAGASILVVPEDAEPYEIAPPSFVAGFREGCGDAMMGAIAAGWANRRGLREALRLGAAAGSVEFLRHDLAGARREAVQALLPQIVVSPGAHASAA